LATRYEGSVTLQSLMGVRREPPDPPTDTQFIEHVRAAEMPASPRPDDACLGEIFAALAETIERIHDKGIIHRDVKSANILVKPEGGRLGVVVCDFDTAWSKGEALTDTVHMTPEFAAPEAATEPVPASDVYAYAVTIATTFARTQRPGKGGLDAFIKGLKLNA